MRDPPELRTQMRILNSCWKHCALENTDSSSPSIERGGSGSTAGRLPRDMKGSDRQLLDVPLECLRQALEVPRVGVMSDGNPASGIAGGDQDVPSMGWLGCGRQWRR